MNVVGIDIGGTKVEAARISVGDGRLTVQEVVRFASGDYPDLASLLKAFAIKGHYAGVGIGVAGPVMGRRVRLTNLPWEIDALELERQLGVPVILLNDLEAHGYGLDHLSKEGLVTLNPGKARPGNRALIAAGTGLGEALLFWDGARHRPSASEGGHADFAPRNDEEIAFLRFLLNRYEHVSMERVVSGRDGLRNIYEFLLQSGRITVPQDYVSRWVEMVDVGSELAAAHAAGEPFALTILAWFFRLYGAEAGNLALKAMAVNGLYIAGGIAKQYAATLAQSDFMAAFAAKGRFQPLLSAMPVHIVVDPHVGLKGAAAALSMVDSQRIYDRHAFGEQGR